MSTYPTSAPDPPGSVIVYAPSSVAHTIKPLSATVPASPVTGIFGHRNSPVMRLARGFGKAVVPVTSSSTCHPRSLSVSVPSKGLQAPVSVSHEQSAP